MKYRHCPSLNLRTLSEWLSHIESFHRKTIDLGLTRILEVADKTKLNQFSIPVVTVAGTNGKGSTVAILSKLLTTANLKVGSYSSPHLLSVNERIQLNGQNIPSDQLAQAFSEIDHIRGATSLTYFEFFTLAALWIFQKAKLDVIILEVGLGGRLDAVNSVTPSLAIITALGYDHQEYLGNTLDKIASEKAGILRDNIPAIISEQAKLPSLLRKLKTHHNAAYFENQDFGIKHHEIWQYKDVIVPVPKHNLPENSVSLALAAYTILGKQCIDLPSLNTVVFALEDLGMVGRFQTLWLNKKRIIFDVAHNPLGSAWLDKKLNTITADKVLAVWASLKDKDLANIISPLLDKVTRWYVGEIDNPRAASSEDLKQALKSSSVSVHNCILDAFQEALKDANEQDTIVVFGSFYTVAEVMMSLSFAETEITHGLILSRC